jgi:hypothetical protein
MIRKWMRFVAALIPIGLLAIVVSRGWRAEAKDDTRLRVVYHADTIVAMEADFEGQEFKVPEAHFANIMNALRPAHQSPDRYKCEAIASLAIEDAQGEKVNLFTHTEPGNHVGMKVKHPKHWERHYSAGRASELRSALKAARDAARPNLSE